LNKAGLLKIRPSLNMVGTVRLPGDKSISHRALLLGAIAKGVSRIDNLLFANVTEAMIDCLTELGVKIDIEDCGVAGAARVTIEGKSLTGFKSPNRPMNCRGSATTMRLLAGIMAGQNFESILDGNDRLRQRPMRRIIDPLTAKGAKILSNNGNAPLTFLPAQLSGAHAVLSVASAQVKSAILLAGLYAHGETKVTEPVTTRDHTERMLRILGVPVIESFGLDGAHTVSIKGPIESLPPLEAPLPSDPSSAAFMAVIGLITSGSAVTVPDVCLNPGRTGLFDVLVDMGADLEVTKQEDLCGEPVGTLIAKKSALTGTVVQGTIVTRMIDEFPIFAVAATQAKGRTVVKDATELRYKESDRIDALATELNKMGANVQTQPDGFIIDGPVKLKGATVNAHGDHRLAMSLAIAGLIAEGETLVEGWEVINDSFTDFQSILKNLGADIQW
jgi:3-phosphoshikimate 1-carboxyvinyltransferase